MPDDVTLPPAAGQLLGTSFWDQAAVEQAMATGAEGVRQQVLLELRDALGDSDGLLELSDLIAAVHELAARDLAPAVDDDGCPALPRPRRLWGFAHTLDREAALYTERDLRQHGGACWRAGHAQGRMAGPLPVSCAEDMAAESAAYEKATGRKARD